MLAKRITDILEKHLSGATAGQICDDSDISYTPENIAAIDVLCGFNQHLSHDNIRWRLVSSSKTSAVLAALENHVQSTGKKIFRASSALSGLPLALQPTDDELKQALGSAGDRFQLLPNNMIKKTG